MDRLERLGTKGRDRDSGHNLPRRLFLVKVLFAAGPTAWNPATGIDRERHARAASPESAAPFLRLRTSVALEA